MHMLPRHLALVAIISATVALQPLSAASCPPAGGWIDRAGKPVAPALALERLAGGRVALLGEQHATPAHHRWQGDVLASLADRGPLLIGLEQLPREAQPALDRWVAGESDEAGFLAESRWSERWGHDFAAYRPVFELARARRIPLVALNIDRAFVRKVGREGFDRAAADGKAPISRPAAPDPAYVARLEESFRQHMREASPQALARFVEAQTVWDRAMAESIVVALRARPDARIGAIMGWGHVADGHGVAHQLAALGVADSVSAIPVAMHPGCEPGAGAADFLFAPQAG
jgi:uncharacterized iron-regulated protein